MDGQKALDIENFINDNFPHDKLDIIGFKKKMLI